MRIGVMAETWAGSLEDLVDEVRFTVEASLETYWMAQVWRFDAMTLIPHLAQLAPTLEFGTSVVASYRRHPMTLASQAMTTNLLTGGPFTLGVGLMHRPAIEGMFEVPFDQPVRHMSEYLDVLLPLLHHQQVDVSGETVSYDGGLDVPNAPACPVMLGALGPRMLQPPCSAGTVSCRPIGPCSTVREERHNRHWLDDRRRDRGPGSNSRLHLFASRLIRRLGSQVSIEQVSIEPIVNYPYSRAITSE